MNRSQIILEDWQYEALKSRAQRGGTSLSALVREAVSAYLSSEYGQAKASLRDMEGVGSDETATGRDHDRFVYALPRRRQKAARASKKRRA